MFMGREKKRRQAGIEKIIKGNRTTATQAMKRDAAVEYAVPGLYTEYRVLTP
jgi:hypothetical protein